MKYAWPLLKVGTLIAALLLIVYAFIFPGDTINASDVFLRNKALFLGFSLLWLLILLNSCQKK